MHPAGQKAVGLIRVHEYDLAARHDVSVHINRINRVRDQHGVVRTEDVEDVAEVALGAVRDEDLVGVQVDAMRILIVADQRLVQEA